MWLAIRLALDVNAECCIVFCIIALQVVRVLHNNICSCVCGSVGVSVLLNIFKCRLWLCCLGCNAMN